MDRDTVVAISLALLAVVALGVAAATLDTAVTPEGDGQFGLGGGDAMGGGDEQVEDVDFDETEGGDLELSPLIGCIPELRSPPALLVMFGVFATFFGLMYRDTGSWFASAFTAVALFIPVLAFWYVFAFCHDGDEPDQTTIGLAEGNDTLFAEAGGATGIGSGGEAFSAPEFAFVVLVVVALLASLALMLTAGRDDDDDGASAEPDEPADLDPNLDRFGRVAERAADRIEADADVDNEVYRAWREMTELLDVDRPESSTPAEFADAAVEAGVAADDVRELTAVFEEVRYGGAEVTDDRERRAVEALRRIADGYAEAD